MTPRSAPSTSTSTGSASEYRIGVDDVDQACFRHRKRTEPHPDVCHRDVAGPGPVAARQTRSRVSRPGVNRPKSGQMLAISPGASNMCSSAPARVRVVSQRSECGISTRISSKTWPNQRAISAVSTSRWSSGRAMWTSASPWHFPMSTTSACRIWAPRSFTRCSTNTRASPPSGCSLRGSTWRQNCAHADCLWSRWNPRPPSANSTSSGFPCSTSSPSPMS